MQHVSIERLEETAVHDVSLTLIHCFIPYLVTIFLLQREDDNVVGKIITSNLNRILMPVVRYDIGDSGRKLENPVLLGGEADMYGIKCPEHNIMIYNATCYMTGYFANVAGN